MTTFLRRGGRLFVAVMVGQSWLLAAAVAQVPGVTVVTSVPPPLYCMAKPTLPFSVTHGTNDSFGTGTPDPAPVPSQSLITQTGVAVGAPNLFDQPATQINYRFGDSLPIAIPAFSTVNSVRLITRMRAHPAGSGNDAMSIGLSNGATTLVALGSKGLAAMNSGAWNSGNVAIFVIDVLVAFPALGPAINNALMNNIQPSLDVFVQDDTGVDFLRLDVCYIAPKPIDVAAQKTRKHGGGYNLSVTNPGGPLPAGILVEVTDYVPVGATVTAFGAAPWNCTAPVSPPFSGPEVITCTMIVPAGGIPPNGTLPTIPVSMTLSPPPQNCPNCMRVRLKPGGGVSVIEQNTANNVSCIK